MEFPQRYITYEKICPICNSKFNTNNFPLQIYCSEECREKMKENRHLAKDNTFTLLGREVEKLKTIINDTMLSLGIDRNVKSVDVKELPAIFAVLINKYNTQRDRKGFAFATVRVNAASGDKIINVPRTTTITEGDMVAVVSLEDIENINKVRDYLLNKIQFRNDIQNIIKKMKVNKQTGESK